LYNLWNCTPLPPFELKWLRSYPFLVARLPQVRSRRTAGKNVYALLRLFRRVHFPDGLHLFECVAPAGFFLVFQAPLCQSQLGDSPLSFDWSGYRHKPICCPPRNRHSSPIGEISTKNKSLNGAKKEPSPFVPNDLSEVLIWPWGMLSDVVSPSRVVGCVLDN